MEHKSDFRVNHPTTQKHEIFLPGLQEAAVTNNPDGYDAGRFYTHPNLPGRYIRAEQQPNAHAAKMNAYYSRESLRSLRDEYSVPVIEHQQMIGPGPDGLINHYLVVPDLEGVVPLKDALSESIDPSLLQEIDQAAAGMAGYVQDLLEQGGIYNREHVGLGLGQLAIVPSREPGERVAFIDVEADASWVVVQPDSRAEHGADDVALGLVHLAKSITQLQVLTNGTDLESIARIKEALDTLSTSVPFLSQISEEASRAVERGDLEAMQQIYRKIAYYRSDTLHEGIEHVRVADFPSRDAISLYIATGEKVFDRELTVEEHALVRQYELGRRQSLLNIEA